MEQPLTGDRWRPCACAALLTAWRHVGCATLAAAHRTTCAALLLLAAWLFMPCGARAQGYPLALQQEWQQEFSEFTQQNFKGLLAPVLTPAEQGKLRRLRFEFPVGARAQPFDFHTVSDGRVVLPVESLLLLKDLALGSSWLSSQGYSIAPVFDYLSVLVNGGLAAWPQARRLPKAALGIPADLSGAPAVMKRYEQLLLSSVLFIVGHELGHLLQGFETEQASPAARQAAERRADDFALELFRRAGLAPVGAAFFFSASSRLVPLAGLTGDEARWRERVAAASHPLDGERIAAAAEFMASRRSDFERAWSLPQTAAARHQALLGELQTLAAVVSRRETAILQADCALSYAPDDLLPRRGALLDLKPKPSERFATAPWSGIYEGEVIVAASGQRTALRAILRRDGTRLAGDTQHLCFRGRLEGRVDGQRASLIWRVGESRRSVELAAGGDALNGSWRSLAASGGYGSVRLQRLPY